MAHLVITHGMKGGVGKSTMSIAAAGHLQQALPSGSLDLYDMQGPGGDLIAQFPWAAGISTASDELGGILDKLVSADGGGVALVDTCADAHLDTWLFECGPAIAVRDGLLRIHVLWVVDGTARSASALADAYACWSRERLGVQLTVLRNLGAASVFQFDQHPIAECLRRDGVPIIDVPACDEAAMAEALAARKGFHAYAATPAPDTAYSRRITVATWLRRLDPVFARLPIGSAETRGAAGWTPRVAAGG